MKVLFVAANPLTSSPLRLGAELREVESKLEASERRDGISLSSVFAARPGDLLQQMNKFRPHILHFSGHGTEKGEIVLEGDDGSSKPVAPAALKALFRSFRPELQVVVLNACYSAAQARAFIDIVDVVVGMNSAVGDDAAVVFASAFYRALGFQRSVAEAFEQGKTAILLEGIDEADTPQLVHAASCDPRNLTLASSPSLLRANDPRVPERLRKLLASGSTLLVVESPDATASLPCVHFELALRHSETTYVVEAAPHSVVGETAATLAHQVMPGPAARQYDWTLVKRIGRQEDHLAAFHTLQMAGVRPSDVLLLVGNHRMPEWAPSAR